MKYFINQKRVREIAMQDYKLRISPEYLTTFSKEIQNLIKIHAERAKSNKRFTLLARDV